MNNSMYFRQAFANGEIEAHVFFFLYNESNEFELRISCRSVTQSPHHYTNPSDILFSKP